MREENNKPSYILGLRINWDSFPENSYIHNIPAIKSISELEFHKNITFFVGENGSGKSTLLEATAIEFGYNPEGGTKNYNFHTFEDTSPLHKAITLIKGWQRSKYGYFFRAETFYNVATASMVEYMGNDYHSNSHGEGILSFLTYDRQGLYIMDEPEAGLSLERQLVLLRHIYTMAQNGSQFIIVTHSPILLGCPNAEILSFDNGKVLPCKYEDTQSYQITKRFLCNKESVLKELLSE